MRRLIPCIWALVPILGLVALFTAGGTAGGAQDASGAKAPAAKDGAAGKEGGAAQASGEYEFVAPLEAVMLKVDDVFQKMEDKIKKEEFKNINKDALFIAEMANLASHYKEHRGKKKWNDLCSSMRDDMLKLAEAAKKKDGAAAKPLRAKVEETCESCHEEFRDN